MFGPAVKRLLGSGSLRSRAGKGAAYLGAGMGAAAYIEHAANIKKNYYGQERYDSYYGSGAETLAGGAKMLGAWYGLGALFGRDPISRGINSFKYRKAQLASTSFDVGTLSFRPKASRYSSSDIKNLSQKPRLGPRHLALYGAAAMGGGTVSPEVMGGTLIGAGVLSGGAIVGAMGYGGTKLLGARGMLHAGVGAGIIGGAGALGYSVATRNNNPAAEGSITSFDRYNSSGVRRMNFSTAGLVQALHNNNRKF